MSKDGLIFFFHNLKIDIYQIRLRKYRIKDKSGDNSKAISTYIALKHLSLVQCLKMPLYNEFRNSEINIDQIIYP